MYIYSKGAMADYDTIVVGGGIRGFCQPWFQARQESPGAWKDDILVEILQQLHVDGFQVDTGPMLSSIQGRTLRRLMDEYLHTCLFSWITAFIAYR